MSANLGADARTEVINFRVTREQKTRLEAARKLAGFGSIGEYIRAIALQRLRVAITEEDE